MLEELRESISLFMRKYGGNRSRLLNALRELELEGSPEVWNSF